MKCINSITICPSNVTITKGKWYYGAYAEICPLDATCKCVTWHSSNPEVASVNEYGYICGVSAGAAVIYATAQDGSGAVGFCNVTVNAPIMVNSVVVTPETKTANVGEKFELSATVYPANAEDSDTPVLSILRSAGRAGAPGPKAPQTAQKHPSIPIFRSRSPE